MGPGRVASVSPLNSPAGVRAPLGGIASNSFLVKSAVVLGDQAFGDVAFIPP